MNEIMEINFEAMIYNLYLNVRTVHSNIYYVIGSLTVCSIELNVNSQMQTTISKRRLYMYAVFYSSICFAYHESMDNCLKGSVSGFQFNMISS